MPIAIVLHSIGIDYGESITIVAWHVEEGQPVEAEDVLLDVETAKSTVEIVAPAAGILGRIDARAGVDWNLRHPVGFILLPGEDATSLPALSVRAPAFEARSEAAPLRLPKANETLPASPRARRLAAELGVDLACVRVDSRDKRITEAHVRRHAANVTKATTGGDLASGKLVALSGRRAAIARHMRSTQHAASVTLHADAEVGKGLAQLRLFGDGGADEARPGLTDLLIAACAVTLRTMPQLNAAFVPEGIWLYDVVNIGVAVHDEGGLVVPVIEAADKLALAALARRRRELQAAVRSGRLPRNPRSTFTVTNLGHVGVRYFTPILNHGTAGILGVGTSDGATLPLSLTFDHQVVDGVPAAEFLQAIGRLAGAPQQWPPHWVAA